MDAFFESTGRLGLSDEDLATLDELETYETQVFAADHTCLNASGYDEVRQAVRVRLEAEFVRENQDRLALIQGERRAAFDALRELLGL